MLKTAPAVFAVEQSYQIMVQVTRPCLFWIRVGECEFYDDANGILRSQSEIHRVTVPMTVLDTAKGYTVCVRPIVERKPYFTTTEPVKEYTYPFSPVPEHDARAYHISDAHNRIDEPVAAANAFGNIDLLILNGDILNHSGDPSKFDNVYEICDRLTKGSIPVVFSRGNHDMRGNFAERFAEYTPAANGKTYYTFRLGGLWGILLDCGEDKNDDHEEYGFTVCCHAFRKRQTAFVRDVIARASEEYGASGIHTRMIIVHNPFTRQDKEPFNIEKEIYTEWASLLKDDIRPHVMICGHTHKLGVYEQGGEFDHLGQPCSLVVGGQPTEDGYAACGYIFADDEIRVVFTDHNGNTFDEQSIRK